MIYFKQGSDFNPLDIQTSSEFIIQYGIDEINNFMEFEANLKTQVDMYCFVDPYAVEVFDRRELLWYLTEEKAQNIFEDRNDDI